MTSSPDAALLARLNALRASSVNLSTSGGSSAPLSLPKPIKGEGAPETHLSERLKALRTTSESSVASLLRPSSPPPTPAPISPKSSARPFGRPVSSLPHPAHASSPPPENGAATSAFNESARQAESLASDIKTTKLFERNPDEDFKLAGEARKAANTVGRELKTNMKWKDVNVEDVARSGDEVKRLRGDAAAALERAKRTLARRDDGGRDDGEDGDSGNDEEGEYKWRRLEGDAEEEDDEQHRERDEDEEAEADALLAELMDDVALDFENEARQGVHQEEPPVGSPHLPPPSSPMTPVPPSKDTDTADERTADGGDVDDDAFHNAMKARMSALLTPSQSLSSTLDLPAAPSSAPVDDLGLPSAPVDKLSSLSISKQPKEDHICKICYDDATIFCEGCEADFEEFDTKEDAMYCARCWREAHLGEGADEEERGHEWVVMRRGR